MLARARSSRASRKAREKLFAVIIVEVDEQHDTIGRRRERLTPAAELARELIEHAALCALRSVPERAFALVRVDRKVVTGDEAREQAFEELLLNTRDAAGDLLEDGLEARAVTALHVLDDIAKVVAGAAQVFLRSDGRESARGVGHEVGEIPALDEGSESDDVRVVFELAEGGDAEAARVVELYRYWLCAVLVVSPGPGFTMTIVQAQERMLVEPFD